MADNPFVGSWTYRSFNNDPDVNKAFNDLEFGRGTIVIAEAPFAALVGTIGGPGWSLTLKGSRSYGAPMQARFQGVGEVGGEKWIYDYIAYLVPDWPNGVNQRAALVGSVIRTIPHSQGQQRRPAWSVRSLRCGRAPERTVSRQRSTRPDPRARPVGGRRQTFRGRPRRAKARGRIPPALARRNHACRPAPRARR